MAKKSKKFLHVGTWNVRSLVESNGDERICRKRPASSRSTGNPDRKLDMLVRELRKYKVSVAGVQETKWFGSDVWTASGYTFLHSGHPLPGNAEIATRREGVGIALDERATQAWKNAGEIWEAISSRIVVARLKWLTQKKQKQSGSLYVSVVCAYAPTAKAPPALKEKFYTNLQDTIDKIDPTDILVLLGDLNARVGVRNPDNGLWEGVIGSHGRSERNTAGEDLLQFCSINQLSIMNTWFQKKEIHLNTWMHPATKKWHMIDFLVMRATQRIYCRDVRVMRGANCWTDHKLVRAKLNIEVLPNKKRKGTGRIPLAIHDLRMQAKREEYQEAIRQQLTTKSFDPQKSSEQNWDALKYCIVESADKSIGRRKQKQPEWFEESMNILTPLIDNKDKAHRKAIQTNSAADKEEFRRQQRLVKKAVDKAKEEWMCQVAQECEEAVKNGRTRWESIRKLQRSHAGRRPIRPSALNKTDGQITQGPEEVAARWQEHFMDILNVPSEYRDEVIDSMPLIPLVSDLDAPPSEEELAMALSKLKRRKAAGKTEISPELVIEGGPPIMDRLLQLFQKVWEDGEVVSDWKNAVVVPIPKKGNLRCCDNWRGICLLDVIGKVFARIVKERLQVIAERILPDSQCGFRKKRGCVDMIFVARQLIEKVREHDDHLFVLFVDLQKAYDSVPRIAMWKVLEKYGTPPKLLSVVRSFHEGMQAEVQSGSAVSEKFEVKNGLRQGCPIAPTLFSIFFCAMVTNWRDKCPEAGVNVLYKHGRKLVGDRTDKAKLNEVRITESQFADDVALYTGNRQAFESAASTFDAIANDWGLTMSTRKTKGMVVGQGLSETDTGPVLVGDGSLEIVDSFVYLGAVITRDAEVTEEVNCRISKASRAFGSLRKPVFQNSKLSLATKKTVYRAVVMSVLLYGAETWTLKAAHNHRLNVFHNQCVRTILGVSRFQQWKERLTTGNLADMFGMQQSIPDLVREQRLRWLGHVGRMDHDRMPKKLLFGELKKKRPRHGPKRRWRDVVQCDVEELGVKSTWYSICQERNEWYQLYTNRMITSSQPTTSNTNHQQSTMQKFTCVCGRSFHRKGDLTRHQRFCS